jgi:hypothetical protein
MSNMRNAEIIWVVNYPPNLVMNDLGIHNRGSNNGHQLFNMKYDDQGGMKREINNGRPFNCYMPTLFLLNLFNENIDARYNASFKQAWISNNAASIPKWTQADVDKNPALAPLKDKSKFKVGDTAILATKYEINDFEQSYTTQYRYKVYDLSAVYHPDGKAKDHTHYVSLKKFEDSTRASQDEAQSARDVFDRC